jgi:hypothetical protein
MAYHHSMQLLRVEDELEIQGLPQTIPCDAGHQVDAAKNAVDHLASRSGREGRISSLSCIGQQAGACECGIRLA